MPMPKKLSLRAIKKMMGKFNKNNPNFKPGGFKGKLNKNLSVDDGFEFSMMKGKKPSLNVLKRKKAARAARKYKDQTPMDYGGDRGAETRYS
jgi:hypothetical protein